jgi:lipoate-protein ligase A
VPVVRRFTAGGAVYNGPGNINWSLFQPGSGGDRGARVFDAAGVFSRSADVVLRALALCGVEGRFDPPNRIVNNKGKISGMAAYISAHGVLCHGTLLAFSDLEELEELSRPTEGALEARYPRSRHAVVSNCGVGRSEFVGALAEALGGDYSPAPLTGGERDLAGQLVAQKYSRASWNLGDPFALDYL